MCWVWQCRCQLSHLDSKMTVIICCFKSDYYRIFSQWICTVRGNMIDWLIDWSAPHVLLAYIALTSPGTENHQSAHSCHESFNLWLHYLVESASANQVEREDKCDTLHRASMQCKCSSCFYYCSLQFYCETRTEMLKPYCIIRHKCRNWTILENLSCFLKCISTISVLSNYDMKVRGSLWLQQKKKKEIKRNKILNVNCRSVTGVKL